MYYYVILLVFVVLLCIFIFMYPFIKTSKYQSNRVMLCANLNKSLLLCLNSGCHTIKLYNMYN